MSDRHRSFQTEDDELAEVTFDINGEIFHCVSVAPGGLFREHLARLLDKDDAAKARAWLGFIEVCMEPEEFERFQAFINAPSNRVGARLIEKITNYLIAEYAGHPTKPSTPSERGRSEQAPTSPDVSSSPDSTPVD